MDARDRFRRAFEHEIPDRVPCFVQSLMPDFQRRLEARLGDAVRDDDILYMGKDFTLTHLLGFDAGWGAGLTTTRVDPTLLRDNPLPKVGAHQSVGITGRVTERGTLGGHAQSWVAGSVLRTVEEAEDWYETYVRPPKHAIPDAVQLTNQMIRGAGPALWTRFVPVAGMPAIIEPLMEGLGLRLFSIMLRKHVDKLKKYLRWFTRDAVLHAELAVETDYEFFALADDSAYKQAPMLNPVVHRELVVPCYKQICDVVRRAGKYIFFHSDGFTEPYFPGLIAAGFHGVESLEPMAGMDLAHLKETYGDALCLIGNVDVSQTLPLGTPGDVAAEVKQCIAAAAEGGGYVVSPCTDLTDAVPVANAEALTRAVRKYGRYA